MSHVFQADIDYDSGTDEDGVVVDDIGHSHLPHDGLPKPSHFVVATDVTLVCVRREPKCTETGDGDHLWFISDVGEHDFGAGLDEPDGDGSADGVGGAGDNDDFPFISRPWCVPDAGLGHLMINTAGYATLASSYLCRAGGGSTRRNCNLQAGGVASPTDAITHVQFTGEEIRAITTVARGVGTYVTAHAYTPAAIRQAISNGVTCIEHGNLTDTEIHGWK